MITGGMMASTPAALMNEKLIVIKTKDAQLNVELSPKTEFKRVSAERPS